ncbi:MAG: hypothetical protein CMJ72_06920 [Planctomycetaceae bacterium]|nr:hypothetical protein [Planctomycetaceae bacterium]
MDLMDKANDIAEKALLRAENKSLRALATRHLCIELFLREMHDPPSGKSHVFLTSSTNPILHRILDATTNCHLSTELVTDLIGDMRSHLAGVEETLFPYVLSEYKDYSEGTGHFGFAINMTDIPDLEDSGSVDGL